MVDTLVVDDLEEWFQLISLILEAEGHRLTHAKNINDAQKYLEDSKYQLLILDAFLPSLNWWELYCGTKANSLTSKIKVVLTFPHVPHFVSDEGKNQIKSLMDNGDGIIIKPFTAQELISVISKVLGHDG
ncbi:MAG: response regulator [Anaerolineales bacterium]|nr:response regulator [Anaerolineales bacterium]